MSAITLTDTDQAEPLDVYTVPEMPDVLLEDAFKFEGWQEAGAAWGLAPEAVPQWWDGVTEVPEGYLWPWQVAEQIAQAEAEAFEFTEEWLAETMAMFNAAETAVL